MSSENSRESFEKVKLWFTKLVNHNSGEQSKEIDNLLKRGVLNQSQSELLKQMLNADSEPDLTENIQSVSNKITIDESIEDSDLLEKQINKYRVIKVLGQGGMGQVYLAERNDGMFEQKVALKLPNHNFNEEMKLRFENERQILAQLTHNNIARLLDGGTTKEGRPYLAMEYIDGQTIDQYCVKSIPDLNARIELIIQTCKAVTFAHQNLILHRDLKPANILVTEEGIVKLLDFGIAKLFNPEDERKANQTATQIMTRNYASPEQIQGKPVSTHSDMFSLAVIAYELITGFHPYQHETQLEREQKLVSGKVMRVTERTDSSKAVFPELSKIQTAKIKGDLENILLKALSIEPEKRYTSVQAFADDLNNYLQNKPVSARKPSTTYALTKLVQRHKITTIAIVMMLVSLAIATIFSINKANIAESQKKIAVIESQKSKQISDFLQNIFTSAQPTENQKEVTVENLLDTAIKGLREDSELQPESKYQLMSTILKSYLSLEKIDNFEKALNGIYEQCSQKLSENDKICLMFLLYNARLEHEKSNDTKALEVYQKVEKIVRSEHKSDTEFLASVLMDQFATLINLDYHDDAEIKVREALSLFESINEYEVASLLSAKIDIAFSLLFNGKQEAAFLYINEIEQSINQHQLEKTQLNGEWLNLKGVYYTIANQPSQSIKYRQNSVDLVMSLFPDKKPKAFGFRLRNLGREYFYAGELEKSLDVYNQAIKYYLKESNGKESEVFEIYLFKTLVLLAQNHIQEAEKEYQLAKSSLSENMKLNSREKCQMYFIDAYFGIEGNVSQGEIQKLIKKYQPCTQTKSYNYYSAYLEILNINNSIQLKDFSTAQSYLDKAWKLWTIYPENYLGIKTHVQMLQEQFDNKVDSDI
ncbi:MAG: serine/threonine-protein kinase [Gammaproteobacteria bacterium]|jgi:serine/threonine protein kinase